MHIEIFRQGALESFELDSSYLIRECCYRFLSAASLLEITGSIINNLQSFYCERIDCTPLNRPHKIILQRYIDEIYSPQLHLIDTAAHQEDRKWHNFYYHKIIPQVISDNQTLKNILRAVKAIPSPSPSQAIDSLCQHFSDLTLPDAQPLWPS